MKQNQTTISSPCTMDAASLLKIERKEIARLLRKYEIPANSQNRKNRASLATDICQAIRHQIWIEQEILYPMTRKRVPDRRVFNYNLVETMVLDYLTSSVESMAPSHPLFDATVEVLGEYALRHYHDQADYLLHNLKELQAIHWQEPEY